MTARERVGPHIVLVHPDLEMRKLLPELLNKAGVGIPIITFSTHEQADHHIHLYDERGIVKLVITNAGVKGMDTGLNLAKKVLALNVTRGKKWIPVMVISGNEKQLLPASQFGAHGVWFDTGDNIGEFTGIVKKLLNLD